MPCYRPITGWRSRKLNENGKRPVVFSLQDAWNNTILPLPCGKCIGCRLERARQWSVRCMHEASLHDASCFVTVTYDDVWVPEDGSLEPEDMTKFIKRLRKRLGRFRYVQCGEYGENTARPHHHMLLYGIDFPDRKKWNAELDSSAVLESTWGKGRCLIGTVTPQSAGYVARYTMKKMYGDVAEEYYGGRCPEYMTMSLKPGIGEGWIRKWWRDVYPADEVILDGKPMKPPRFYDDFVRENVPGGKAVMRYVVNKRIEMAKANVVEHGSRCADGVEPGMLAKEFVKSEQIKSLSRVLEDY